MSNSRFTGPRPTAEVDDADNEDVIARERGEMPDGRTYADDEGGEGRGGPEPREEREAREAREKPVNPVHQGRADIYARKKVEREAPEEDPETPTTIWPKGMEPEEREPDPAPRSKRTLKVYGEDHELTDEEINALAQKQLASETKFEDVKALDQRLRQLEIENEVLKRSRPQAADEDDAQEVDAQTSAKEERRRAKREAIERIQMGDADEALEAFESVFGSEERLSDEDMRAMAREEAKRLRDEERIEAERNSTVQTFATEWPEIFENRSLQLVTADRTHLQMVAEMERIGIDPSDLGPARADPTIAGAWHAQYRAQGYKGLSDPKELVSGVADAVLREFNIPRRERPQGGQPQGQPNREERRNEKRELPREINRAPASGRTAARPPETREEKVARIRAARGQNN